MIEDMKLLYRAYNAWRTARLHHMVETLNMRYAASLRSNLDELEEFKNTPVWGIIKGCVE